MTAEWPEGPREEHGEPERPMGGPGQPLGPLAARGVGLLVGRTIGLQLLTAGVTVALAHILDPADYGIFAIGQAAQMLGLRFSEMGIATALLRRAEEPTAEEQKALLTVFLSLGLSLCTIAFLLAFAILPWSGLEEEGAQVVAVCLLAIPIYACRAVPVMLIERQLGYGRIAVVETGETLAFNAFALVAALIGLGAYSLAGAIPAAALVGTAIAWHLQPFARGLTRHLSPVRPLIRFGIALTSLQTVNLGGALAFVSALTAAGGASLAGYYALAQRLFAFPIALTSALLRVSFPALSRGAAGARARRAGRAAILCSIVVGLPLALVVGAADPLIEVLFGDEWLPVADLLVLGSVGMMLIAAAVVPMTSLSLAEGRTASPIAAAVLQYVVLVGGALAIANLASAEVGTLIAAGAAINVGLLATRTERVVRHALLSVLLALGLSAAAAAAGQALGADDDVAGLVASVAVTGLVWLVLTTLFMREPATDVWRLMRPYLARLRPLFPVVVIAAAAGAAVLALSGGEKSGPRTPAGIEGHAPPFLGVAVIGGGGGLAGAVDSYGTVVDLRLPGPAGESQISLPHRRQEAGTVSPRTGLTLGFAGESEAPEPAWEAAAAVQRYLPGTNVLRTFLSRDDADLVVTDGVRGRAFARGMLLTGDGDLRLRVTLDLDLAGNPGADRFRAATDGFTARDGARIARCEASPPPAVTLGSGNDPYAAFSWQAEDRIRAELICGFASSSRPPASIDRAASIVNSAPAADRRWLASGDDLGPGAPPWARALHARSLLVLRALTDPGTGAMAAGLREAWAYVWPRDAATAALALAEAGHAGEARAIARFLSSLDLAAGARFFGDGTVVGDGRPAQGDAGGWTRLAREATGLVDAPAAGPGWRGRPDYGERSGDSGDYIANAIVAGVRPGRLGDLFTGRNGLLVRRAAAPASEIDSAVAWAVRPFPRPELAGQIAATLRAVGRTAGPYGLEPHTRWPGEDPWTAPAAWMAWAEAGLGHRAAAIAHLARLRRAATDALLLPERVDVETGLPSSTTPLGWSHAFAILALRELWPPVRSR